MEGENAEAVWLINRLRWGFIDGMGGINIQGIITAMQAYQVPPERQGPLLEKILSLTKMVQAAKGNKNG